MPTIIGLAAVARSGKDTVASMLLEHEDVAAYAMADPLKSGCQSLFGLTEEETWSDFLKEKRIAIWGMSPRQMFQWVGTDILRDHNPEHWLLRADRHLNHLRLDSPPPSSEDLAQPSSYVWLAVQSIWGLTLEQAFDPLLRSTIDPFWSLTPNQMFEVLTKYLRKDFPLYEQTRLKLQVLTPSRTLNNPKGKNIFIIKDIRFENEAAFWRSHHGVIWHVIRKGAEKVNAHMSEAGIKCQHGDWVIENNGSLEELRQKVELAWNGIHTRGPDQ